jgi:hypothetical protein
MPSLLNYFTFTLLPSLSTGTNIYHTPMAGVFDKPGLLFGVWLVCVGTQFAAYYKVPIPGWWLVVTFFGAVAPIVKLIFA